MLNVKSRASPLHVRDLVDAILNGIRDGSLAKEHMTVLKNSLELVTKSTD